MPASCFRFGFEPGELGHGHVLDAGHRHADLRGHQEILPDGEVREDAATLGHGADAAAGPAICGERRHHVAVEVNVTGGRREGSGTDVEQGGLAAPVRSQEGDDGTGRDGEGDAVHDLDRSVSGADISQLEDGGVGVHAVPRYAWTTAGSFFTCSGVPLAMIWP